LKQADSNTFIDNPLIRAPFSRGARSCLGMRIAQLEMDTVVARLVQDHELTLAPGEDKLKPTERQYRQNLGNHAVPTPRYVTAPAL
jgi:cytochrome P450